MGKALYRKYRSKSLSEVIGQEHITDALKKALDSNIISHAYLFTGPRGVGKTSVARILAHEINKLPYDENEDLHLDIIEIDAASNRRIDEIRDLKDKVHVAPTSAKYKVYIIDEVHMLTKEAFNALLKTLEEPPAHIVFILATTEAHKLPETIISRTQRFTFRPVSEDAVINHLAGIAKTENIVVDKKALQLIAQHGEGSFRDSISLLDQMQHSSKNITEDDVENALGIAPLSLVSATLEAIKSGKNENLNQALEDVTKQGIDTVKFAHQLSEALRSRLISQTDIPQEADIMLLEMLSMVGTHPKPKIALEISLLKQLALRHAPHSPKVTKEIQKQEMVDDVHSAPEPELPPENTYEETPAYLEPVDIHENIATTENSNEWTKVLDALKKKHSTIYGVVRMANPNINEDTILLNFNFPFHAKRISEEKNRRVLEDTIFETTGKRLTVKTDHKKQNQHKPTKAPEKASNVALENVSNIFGRVEIVES